MEVTVFAVSGKPVAVGTIGTITLGETNERGETAIRFALSRAFENKISRRSTRGGRRLVDGIIPEDHTAP